MVSEAFRCSVSSNAVFLLFPQGKHFSPLRGEIALQKISPLRGGITFLNYGGRDPLFDGNSISRGAAGENFENPLPSLQQET